MTSLRARIAILLIVAICTVVGLATLAAVQALQHPQPAATMEPVARQIQLLARLARNDPAAAESAGARIAPGPAAGVPDEGLTRFLMAALTRTGAGIPARVSRGDGAPALTASVDLGAAGWLITDIPDLSPPEGGWLIFTLWIVMIVLGSVVVAVYAAGRVTRPLELLESAAGRIGTDGTLSHVPETGTAEVRATARALNRLSLQLGVAMESRMRLVAAAGHDLRTPMTRMRLRAEFIEEDEDRAKWLSDLEELDQIADSAIRLVREEASQDGTELLRLDALLRDIAGELGELRHPLRLGDLAAVTVRAGPLALKRALRNLMVNAATHGGGADIAIAREGAEAVVLIRDHGPGIPQDLLGRVFEPFFRVDPARRKTVPGAGLGLAIAREIIERFGGRISLRNATPFGLEQRVVLPVAPVEGQFEMPFWRGL